jgi:hypothetical protein
MALTKATNRMIDGAYINILDYDVDPTGTNDCSAAVTTAIATGKSIFFPKGFYRFNSTVTINGGEGQILFGEGPNRTYIYAPTSTAAFAIPSAPYLVGIRDMTIFGTASTSIGLLLGTRGNPSTGAGATFANTPRFSNLRFANCDKGIYIFGCNGGSFRDIFYESCEFGQYVQPVDSGNCNANYFSNQYFYDCETPFTWLSNADTGADASENYFTGGIEASGTRVFAVRGLGNTFDLWLDSQSGAVGPDVSSSQGNYYIIKNFGSVTMPTWGVSKAIVFAGAQVQDRPAFITKPSTNSGNVLDCSNGLGATVQTSNVWGTGDNGQVLVENTSTGTVGQVLLNCLLDVPVGYKITLVSSDSSAQAGITLQIPNNATWTYYGFAHNDTILSFAAAGTTYTILKAGPTTLVRLI